MDTTAILLIIAILFYGFVFVASGVIEKKIARAKGSSDKTLRAGIFLVILRYGPFCPSELSEILNKPVSDINTELNILKKRKVVRKKEHIEPKGFEEPVYCIGS